MWWYQLPWLRYNPIRSVRHTLLYHQHSQGRNFGTCLIFFSNLAGFWLIWMKQTRDIGNNKHAMISVLILNTMTWPKIHVYNRVQTIKAIKEFITSNTYIHYIRILGILTNKNMRQFGVAHEIEKPFQQRRYRAGQIYFLNNPEVWRAVNPPRMIEIRGYVTKTSL